MKENSNKHKNPTSDSSKRMGIKVRNYITAQTVSQQISQYTSPRRQAGSVVSHQDPSQMKGSQGIVGILSVRSVRDGVLKQYRDDPGGQWVQCRARSTLPQVCFKAQIQSIKPNFKSLVIPTHTQASFCSVTSRLVQGTVSCSLKVYTVTYVVVVCVYLIMLQEMIQLQCVSYPAFFPFFV